jgi:DNA-binding winged helix-turn-helix (wHTH) protein
MALADADWCTTENGTMRYTFGDYLLDMQRYELYCVGKPVPVRPKVCEMLAYLLAHRDRVVSKDELIERLRPDQYASDATLNSCMLEVRKAIGDSGQAPRLLRTVRGRGYRFVALAEEQEQVPLQDTLRLAPSRAPEILST